MRIDLPGRASDAGPDTSLKCPDCGLQTTDPEVMFSHCCQAPEFESEAEQDGEDTAHPHERDG